MRLLAASNHPKVAAALARVTERRVGYLAHLFELLGFPPPAAHQRGFLLYTSYVGHAQLAHAAPGTVPADPHICPRPWRRSSSGDLGRPLLFDSAVRWADYQYVAGPGWQLMDCRQVFPFDGVDGPDGVFPFDGVDGPDGVFPFDGVDGPDGVFGDCDGVDDCDGGTEVVLCEGSAEFWHLVTAAPHPLPKLAEYLSSLSFASFHSGLFSGAFLTASARSDGVPDSLTGGLSGTLPFAAQ
ncbi:hypothetical protein ACWC9T_40960 [Kitasatospora sp. NPDC001159]